VFFAIVATPAVPHGHSIPLILQGLIIVRRLVTRGHGVGAAVTGRAEYFAMPGSIAVQRCPGVHLGHAGSTGHIGIVASHARGLIRPGNARPTGNAGGNRGQRSVASHAGNAGGNMLRAAVAESDSPRVTVITAGRSRQGCMESMDRFGQVFDPRLEWRIEGRTAMAGGAADRLGIQQIGAKLGIMFFENVIENHRRIG